MKQACRFALLSPDSVHMRKKLKSLGSSDVNEGSNLNPVSAQRWLNFALPAKISRT